MDADSFAHRYLVAKVAEVDAALQILDGRPDALEHHETRKRLVEIRERFILTLAQLKDEPPQLQ